MRHLRLHMHTHVQKGIGIEKESIAEAQRNGIDDAARGGAVLCGVVVGSLKNKSGCDANVEAHAFVQLDIHFQFDIQLISTVMSALLVGRVRIPQLACGHVLVLALLASPSVSLCIHRRCGLHRFL